MIASKDARQRAASAHFLTVATIVLAFTTLPESVPRSIVIGGSQVLLYQIALVICALAWLVQGRPRPSTDRTAILFLSLTAVAIGLSLIAGFSVSQIVTDVRFFAFIGVAVFIAGRAWDREGPNYAAVISVVMWVSAAMTLVASVTGLGLGQTERGASLELGDESAASRLVTEATYPAVVVLTACFCLFLMGKIARRATLTLVLPAAIIVLLSFSRNPILSLVIAIPVALLLSPSKASVVGRLLKLLAVTSLGLVIVWAIAGLDPQGAAALWLNSQVAGITDRVIDGLSPESLSLDGSTRFRTEQENPYLYAAVGQSPILGHGFGFPYKPAFTGRYFATAEAAMSASQYAHLFYLWLMVKTGIVGVIAFLALTLVPALKALRRGTPAIVSALSAALIGMMAQSFFAPMPVGSPTAVLFGGLLGLVVVGITMPRDDQVTRKTQHRATRYVPDPIKRTAT